ncbi:hypothetical protein ACFLWZ_03360 [Chloroflexota bacterium]
MGVLAVILGTIGGICAAVGVVTAADIIPLISAQLTWTFWLMLSAILLLAFIAVNTRRYG